MALIAAFVLLLGVGALASRTNFGFIGQAFQGQNRQARDVAESAIAQFASAMNREENRYLLIAGNTGNWGTLDSRNVCTVYDNAGELIGTRRDTVPNDYTPADPAVITRFRPNNGAQVLVPGDDSRTFVVEQIEFRRADANRTPYNVGTQTPPDADWVYRQNLKRGDSPALIRITVVGSVNQNNRTSTARIAKEFEVVPKCCKRSFGAQAAQNLGRDRQACSVEAFEGGRGLIIGLNGGGITRGTGGGGFDIRDERGLVTQALCWGGSPPDTNEPSDLTGNPSTACTNGTLQLGQTTGQGTGITFSPEQFDLVLPRYAKVTPDDYLATLVPFNANGALIDPGTGNSLVVLNPSTGSPIANETEYALLDISRSELTINRDKYIYFDPGSRRLRICNTTTSGIDLTSCTALQVSSETIGGTAYNVDVCYERIDQNAAANPRRPYAEVNCRLRNISSGNNKLYIDTSNARINLFFDDDAYTGEIMGGGGNTDIIRLHCSWGGVQYNNYDANNRCNYILPWTANDDRDFQAICDSAGGSPCGLKDAVNTPYDLDYYDISELFNVYATGAGTFDLKGQSSSIGMNIYALKATVRIRGGGNAEPNLMGRLWVNSLTLSGGGQSLAIRVPSTGPSFLDDDNQLFNTLDYWDFIVRSFTQSSGFGL